MSDFRQRYERLRRDPDINTWGAIIGPILAILAIWLAHRWLGWF